MFFNPLIPVQGRRLTGASPSNSGHKVGGTTLGQDALPSLGSSHTHTHSDWDNVDTPFTSHAYLWDVGGNGRKSKKT